MLANTATYEYQLIITYWYKLLQLHTSYQLHTRYKIHTLTSYLHIYQYQSSSCIPATYSYQRYIPAIQPTYQLPTTEATYTSYQ